MSEELLYNQLYERTKDFGRTQFIKEIMRLERENQQLKEKIEDLKQMVNFDGITIVNCPECKKKITVNFCRETEKYRQQRDLYKSVIDEIKDKLLCYGETFDSNIHQQFQRECLEILDKANIKENK